MIIVPPPSFFPGGSGYVPHCRHCGKSYPLSVDIPTWVFWMIKLTILSAIGGSACGWWMSENMWLPSDIVGACLTAVSGIMLGTTAPWALLGALWCLRFLFRSPKQHKPESP